MNDEYIKQVEKMAIKAFKKNEVPIGAIIVKNNKIIAKAYNKKNKYNNPLYHAEIIAINKACKKEKDWRLNDCILYVTLEPCPMCMHAIAEARIEKVIFLCKTNYNSFKTPTKEYIESYLSKTILQQFFKRKREQTFDNKKV